MPETPEQKARREIDADLVAAGWLVQDRDDFGPYLQIRQTLSDDFVNWLASAGIRQTVSGESAKDL